ncbi:hypothetical protein PYW08_000487 [Mythimna loreyi]|uniref:Uncharacterized protein n=1 Tax=Mythimna loreyi TaxID=667449 RepID=A0ACC2RCL6_9NEOP|nr:hypothetical protein PYW08_000487 [Mythimna loreyi]
MSDLFVNAILGVSSDEAGGEYAGAPEINEGHIDEGTDMFEVAANVVIPPPFIMPLPEPPLKTVEPIPPPWAHDHAPGHFCTFCWCDNCRKFFGTGKPVQIVHPRPREAPEVPPRPRYSYMNLVNSMRAASARREEERQKRRQAEREQANGEKSPKKPKPSKSPKKKNVRQTAKRRRP